ncbi:sulfatase [Cellulophaga sp. F20128]|uniref:sulfatase family protein n=1 Tax=Cellulophaga sp. F20128 TaxID=2926413 RepID=UPI001FF334BD|nr:sulfatase [Cellulophaga sp. F20128]MCK0156964.1 sulfatase [Cellulophaga sp. F20128]
MKNIFILALSFLLFSCKGAKKENSVTAKRPNILFCIADDWGWPHAGVYGDKTVKTPAFDRLANEGVLFQNAFISSPSCTPSRSAILTGQHFWRLGEGANLWSTLDVNIPVYPLLLEKYGYHTGHWRKAWGPGDLKKGGYSKTNPAGKNYNKGLKSFLDTKPTDAPFCFWLGSSDPHRPYEKGSGMASGINIDAIKLPDFYPDDSCIRSDIADYYFEVQRFDADVYNAIKLLEERGELENTIIVMTGDHGMPFPRCKGNLYDWGSRVPLAIRWGAKVPKNRIVNDFVSLTDLAVTFLEAAQIAIPKEMTGKSLLPILQSNKQGWIENQRKQVVYGRERHTPAQLAPSLNGYPSRAIRTKRFLYIKNLKPERWPAGVMEGATHPMSSFSDADNGATKTVLMNLKNTEASKYYDLSFAKRPADELYDVVRDPFQIKNLAEDPQYKTTIKKLSKELYEVLRKTKDPRITDTGSEFDRYPYNAPYKLKE